MPLTPGTKLGPYEIQTPLGAGGMGEVYRALDTRLDRTVAVKVLASHLSSSPELKQRMEREARAISSLNHPNICQLYDIGSQDGSDFLVMEFLEGETLADRLRKSFIPLNEVLKIGVELAQALGAAHRHGIVHRDLKPGNIMLTQSGAKLMDFGLAKPLSASTPGSVSVAPPSFTATIALSSPSPLSPLTTVGSIVGTIQYMAPEQIEGREADARSDIFAFGNVLYEMVAGKRPFEGKSQLSLASSILEKDPAPIGTLRPQVPPAFEHLVATCLQKNPDDRFQCMNDIKLNLQWIGSEPSPSADVASPVAPQSARPAPLAWIAALIVAIALGILGGMFLRHPAPTLQSTHAIITPPDKTTLNLTGDYAGPPVLSPDGTSIAFTATGTDGKTLLWVRPVNSLEAHSIPETTAALFPFWSPDSRSLGFFAEGKLKTVDLNSGAVLAVCEAPLARGGAWGAEGVILFSPNVSSPLMRVSASGGTPVPITKVDAAQVTSHRWPFFLPDGKHFLYLAIHHDPSKSANNTVYYASSDGRENRLLFRSQSNAVYAAGYILFAHGDQLMAQSFDPAKGNTIGDPRPLAKGVIADLSTWHMDASASDNGLLTLGSGGTGDLQLVWLDRASKQVSVILDKLNNVQGGVISPQGDRIALQIDAGINDVWILDLSRGVRTRLTFGPISNTNPVWSPDGKWIAYSSPRDNHFNLYRKPSDGSGAEESLATAETQLTSFDWSRDGKFLIYGRRADLNEQIWALPLEGDAKPSLVVSSGTQARLSPDGRWLAYVSTESGGPEVYVVPFGGGQGKWQVSTNGGGGPKWSKDGSVLYYMDLIYTMFAVPVKVSGGALQLGATQTLLSNWSAPQVFFDVAPDDRKILLHRVSQQVNQSVTFITNFPAGLKQ